MDPIATIATASLIHGLHTGDVLERLHDVRFREKSGHHEECVMISQA